eukprot:gene11990-biopygen8357
MVTLVCGHLNCSNAKIFVVVQNDEGETQFDQAPAQGKMIDTVCTAYNPQFTKVTPPGAPYALAGPVKGAGHPWSFLHPSHPV